MKIVKQLVTDYISINLPQEFPTWDQNTTYSFGADVVYERHHWRSATDNNTGNEPTIDSRYWIDMGASNRYAMVDDRPTTPTVWTPDTDEAFQFVIYSDNIDTIAFIRSEAQSILIEVLDGGGNVVQTVDRGEYVWCSGGASWFNYYFGRRCPVKAKGNSTAFYFSIDPEIGGFIRITMKPTNGKVSVGAFIAGTAVDAGCALTGTTRAAKSTGSRKRDDFGVFTGRRRTPVQTMSINVKFDPSEANRLFDLGLSLLDSPALVIGDESDNSVYDGLVIYGEITSAPQTLTTFGRDSGSWTIEESA